jgi:hypothetical protein
MARRFSVPLATKWVGAILTSFQKRAISLSETANPIALTELKLRTKVCLRETFWRRLGRKPAREHGTPLQWSLSQETTRGLKKMAQPIRREQSPDQPEPAVAAALTVVPIRLETDDDPLGGFTPEQAAPAAVVKPVRAERKAATPAQRAQMRLLLLTGVAALTAALVGVGFYRQLRSRSTAPAAVPVALGRATLQSRPDGAVVLVDGVKRGVTPLTLDLPVGAHAVVFQNGGAERHLTINVDAGTRVSENVDLPSAAPAVGQIEVTSDPPGARVAIDGGASGITPLTLRNVAVARHVVAVGQGDTIVNRTVDVTAGASSSVFVSLAGGPRSAGFVEIESPLEMRILENGQLLGLSTAAPLMLRAGAHKFDLVNEGAEVHLARTVTIDAGKTAHLRVPLPNGTLSVNASPWAEVFVDGRSIGVTPLGDVQVPVGSREIVWRHPQFGEKRQTVMVGAQTPARVSVDFRK